MKEGRWGKAHVGNSSEILETVHVKHPQIRHLISLLSSENENEIANETK